MSEHFEELDMERPTPYDELLKDNYDLHTARDKMLRDLRYSQDMYEKESEKTLRALFKAGKAKAESDQLRREMETMKETYEVMRTDVFGSRLEIFELGEELRKEKGINIQNQRLIAALRREKSRALASAKAVIVPGSGPVLIPHAGKEPAKPRRLTSAFVLGC